MRRKRKLKFRYSDKRTLKKNANNSIDYKLQFKKSKLSSQFRDSQLINECRAIVTNCEHHVIPTFSFVGIDVETASSSSSSPTCSVNVNVKKEKKKEIAVSVNSPKKLLFNSSLKQSIQPVEEASSIELDVCEVLKEFCIGRSNCTCSNDHIVDCIYNCLFSENTKYTTVINDEIGMNSKLEIKLLLNQLVVSHNTEANKSSAICTSPSKQVSIGNKCRFVDSPTSVIKFVQSSSRDEQVFEHIDARVLHRLLYKLQEIDCFNQSNDLIYSYSNECYFNTLPELMLFKAIYANIPSLRNTCINALCSTLSDVQTVNDNKPFIKPLLLSRATLYVCQQMKTTPQQDSAHSTQPVSILLRVLMKFIKLIPCPNDPAFIGSQATAYNCIIQNVSSGLSQLVMRFPHAVTEKLITWILRQHSTTINHNMRIRLLDVIDTVLHLEQTAFLFNGSSIHLKVFKYLSQQCSDTHTSVAKRSMSILKSPHIILNLLAPFAEINKLIRQSLYQVSKHHWNETIRKFADDLFDQMLDFF